MEINKEYIFEDKNDLVNYLLYKLNLPSQLKIQKTLYLLFAFYGATYGKLINDENNSELDSSNYTPFLFEPNFQAWKYGPVDYDVYINFKKEEKYKELKSIENKLNEDLTEVEKRNIITFINNIINQTDEMDDYTLMDRTREDKVWSDSYSNKEKNMNPILIVNEYNSKYV
jgi:hypothetical protein